MAAESMSFTLGLAPECPLNGDGALASLNDFGWVVFGSKHCGQVVGWQDFYKIASCVHHLFHSVNKSFFWVPCVSVCVL